MVSIKRLSAYLFTSAVTTVSAKTTFANDIDMGDGNDKITLNAETEMDGAVNLGMGTNTISVNKSLKISSHVHMTTGGSTTIIVNRDTTFAKNTLQVWNDADFLSVLRWTV